MKGLIGRSTLGVITGLAWLIGGCDCRGSGGVTRNLGEIGVVWRDAAGERIINREAVYDFGNALVGGRNPLTMTIRNVGPGRLKLAGLERSSGDEAAIATTASARTAFEVLFGTIELEPSGQVEYEMAFTPTGSKTNYETQLTLTAEGAPPEASTATITLRGKGEQGACDLPSVIDFGKVPVGETLPYPLKYPNPTTLPATGNIGTLTGTDATSFGFSAGAPQGSFTVEPRTTKAVGITFSPTEKRSYEAQITAQGAGECPQVTIRILGQGSDEVMTWSPTELKYGAVNPGDESVREVLFVNPSGAPITMTNVVSQSPRDFYQVVEAGTDPSTFIAAPLATTPMRIACNPSQLGVRDSILTFKTPLKSSPSGTIALKCKGGGPKIRVTPRPSLAFGRVGFFPENPSFSVARKVTVQNVGLPDPTANLFLGSVAAGGSPGQLPLFEVISKNSGTAPDEFTLGLGSPYNPNAGLEAVAGKNSVDIVVRLSPKSLGPKAAEVVIYSNDSAEPQIRIAVSADVQDVPPCNYRVSPTTANFGLVTPPITKDLPIAVTNLGVGPTDVCYLSGVELAAGSDLAYTVVGGPVVEKKLEPQETWNVVLRVQPRGPVPTSLQTLTGALVFNVTSPTAPQASVPLRTSVGPTCLAITPDPLDFGTTKSGCNSAPRTLNLYNICDTRVVIQAINISAGAGQPPGGPNCPGSEACHEFFKVASTTIPPGGLALAAGSEPAQVQVKYAPMDVGADNGAVAIDALQNGQSITFLVALRGSGDGVGKQTDTFKQDLKPKADILLVIDDSGSMGSKQQSLADNFSAFIRYAVSANVDYHLGITTTTLSNRYYNSKAPGGLLYRNPNLGIPAFLTPSTPNVANAFSQAVKVGTGGDGDAEMGLETAVRALTPPLIAAENSGFLRDEANLAVVVITDTSDQSPKPVSYYKDRLVNVKGFNRLSEFTFNLIGPLSTTPTCPYDPPGNALKYMDLVTFTSGVSDEICSSNWSQALEKVGTTAFGYRTRFFLTNTPDLSSGQTLQVLVDGTPRPASDWTYNGANNAIEFTATTRPQAGQELSVTYSTACF